MRIAVLSTAAHARSDDLSLEVRHDGVDVLADPNGLHTLHTLCDRHHV